MKKFSFQSVHNPWRTRFICFLFICFSTMLFISACDVDKNDEVQVRGNESTPSVSPESCPKYIESLPDLLKSEKEIEHDESALKELIAILKLPTVEHLKKWGAVQKITDFGYAATPKLIEILNEHDTGESHYYAIRSLGYIRDPQAIAALCNILLDRNYGPRRYAAMALGQIGNSCAVDALHNALSDVAHVRDDAIGSLVKIDSTESREVLNDYYFGNSSQDFELIIECDKQVYEIGDSIQINATMINTSKKTPMLCIGEGEQFGMLVFRRTNGSYIEKIDTGLREHRVIGPVSNILEFNPNDKVNCSFAGRVVLWTRGEKDDHSFVPSEVPFLTLDFRTIAFHIRETGEYKVNLVFLQDEDLIKRVGRSSGESHEQFWQGKVVSNSVSFSVLDEGM